MDERAFQVLATDTRQKILQQTESDELTKALQRLTRRMNETVFNNLCKAITEKRRDFLKQSDEERRDGLMNMLNVTQHVPLESFGDAFIKGISNSTLVDAAQCLKKSGTSDQKLANSIETLLAALKQFTDFEMLFPTMEDFFMTDNGPRKKFATKSVAEEFPKETGYLLELQAIYIRLREDFLAQLNLQISLDIYTLADALLAEIDLKKNQQGYLDYDDLIFMPINFSAIAGILDGCCISWMAVLIIFWSMRRRIQARGNGRLSPLLLRSFLPVKAPPPPAYPICRRR